MERHVCYNGSYTLVGEKQLVVRDDEGGPRVASVWLSIKTSVNWGQTYC